MEYFLSFLPVDLTLQLPGLKRRRKHREKQFSYLLRIQIYLINDEL